jgi:hypothetical protein
MEELVSHQADLHRILVGEPRANYKMPDDMPRSTRSNQSQEQVLLNRKHQPPRKYQQRVFLYHPSLLNPSIDRDYTEIHYLIPKTS